MLPAFLTFAVWKGGSESAAEVTRFFDAIAKVPKVT